MTLTAFEKILDEPLNEKAPLVTYTKEELKSSCVDYLSYVTRVHCDGAEDMSFDDWWCQRNQKTMNSLQKLIVTELLDHCVDYGDSYIEIDAPSLPIMTSNIIRIVHKHITKGI